MNPKKQEKCVLCGDSKIMNYPYINNVIKPCVCTGYRIDKNGN